MSNTLLPCPFCGGEQAIKTRYIGYGSLGLGGHDEYRVVCQECRASSDEYRSKAEAIVAWNTRHTPEEITDALSRLEELQDFVDTMPLCVGCEGKVDGVRTEKCDYDTTWMLCARQALAIHKKLSRLAEYEIRARIHKCEECGKRLEVEQDG
jgi:Lar family restriction alleviation protein